MCIRDSCLVVHLDRFVPLPLFPGEPDASENGNDDDEFDEDVYKRQQHIHSVVLVLPLPLVVLMSLCSSSYS